MKNRGVIFSSWTVHVGLLAPGLVAARRFLFFMMVFLAGDNESAACVARSDDSGKKVGSWPTTLQNRDVAASGSSARFACATKLVSMQSIDSESRDLERVLSLWRVSRDCETSPEASQDQLQVEAEIGSRSWMLVAGSVKNSLKRTLWHLINPFSVPDGSLATFSVLEDKIIFVRYHRLSCEEGSFVTTLLPIRTFDRGIPFGAPLLDEAEFGEPIGLPWARFGLEDGCSIDYLHAEALGPGVLLTLANRAAERLDTIQFFFVPEEPDGCGKWYKSSRGDLIRVRYDRPLGTPEKELEHIREMERKCEDF